MVAVAVAVAVARKGTRVVVLLAPLLPFQSLLLI